MIIALLVKETENNTSMK